MYLPGTVILSSSWQVYPVPPIQVLSSPANVREETIGPRNENQNVEHMYSVFKDVKVRFICPSLIEKAKTFRVRATYENSPGLSTTLHYPQQCKQEHIPYTCKPKTTGVRAKYTCSNDMQTTLHYPQRIVAKHYM